MLLRLKREMRINIGMAVLLTALMFALLSCFKGLFIMAGQTLACCFSMIYGAALAYAIYKRFFKGMAFLFFSAGLFCLLLVRASLMPLLSDDYTLYLSPWIASLRPYTLFEALGQEISNYNVPYILLLAVISKLPFNELILLKSVSCAFDVAMAFVMMKYVAMKTENKQTWLLAFLLLLAVPTVAVNSGWWAQCDSIYTFFCLEAFYCALNRQSQKAVALFSVGFIFKLQAVFALPLLMIMTLNRRIKGRDWLLFPAINAAALIPSLLAGRSLGSLLSIYSQQVVQYSALTLKCPNFYAFFPMEARALNSYPDIFGGVYALTVESALCTAGILITGGLLVMLAIICYNAKDKLRLSDYITVFYLSVAIVVYFLPRMHERYFYMADVLSIALLFFNKRLFYVPVATIVCSLAGYIGFFSELNVPLEYYALLMLATICLVARQFYLDLSEADGISLEA